MQLSVMATGGPTLLVEDGGEPGPSPPSSGEEPDGEALCWVCRDPERPEPLVAPCRCRGSMRGVHAPGSRKSVKWPPGLDPAFDDKGCGEPYQAEHQPANLCACLKAHLRGCMEELQEETRNLRLQQVCGAIVACSWSMMVMVGSTMLTSGGYNQACYAKNATSGRCGLAGAVYVALVMMLALESMVVLVSFGMNSLPNSCLLRPFFVDTTSPPMQAAVVLIWVHLWVVPAIATLGCCIETLATMQFKAKIELAAWWMLIPLLVPALLPNLRQAICFFRSGRALSSCRRMAQGVRSCCTRCCSRQSLQKFLSVMALILHPALPWLQTMLCFPFGMAWFSPGDATLRYWILGSTSAVAVPAACFAWLRICCKGPLHEDYHCPYEDGVRMHVGWFGALAFLLYSGFSVHIEGAWLARSKRDPVRTNDAAFAVWCLWVFLVGSYAIYANGTVVLAYSRRWRLQNGRLVIGGEQDALGPTRWHTFHFEARFF
ncbi:unnamed protein product [Effrenium voratum]|nr:unnamed protein product [Effrenium voratum]